MEAADEVSSAILHCSFENCAFHKKKGFKRQLLLDQHILNCHTQKRHKCSNCGKQYAIEWQLKYHLKTCGSVWTCSTCHKVYKERLSLITHCNRNDHALPEDAKRKNLISNKESQRKSLSNSFAISKYRPILPKNELSSSESSSQNGCNSSPLSYANLALMVASVGANLLPLANRSNAPTSTPVGKLANGHDTFTPVESLAGVEQLSEFAKVASVMATGSILSNLNLQPDCLADNYCQTELLCQCPAQNVQSNKRDKSTNTPAVQCPERVYSATSLKRKARPSSVARQETHTQTYDSFFVERPMLRHQSTCTEINSDNFPSPKRRSVSSETTINNLNKNVCFLDGQADHPGNPNNHQFNVSYQNILHVSNMPLSDQPTINGAPNGVQMGDANSQNNVAHYEMPSNQQDPLLSTISVQTDLDYLDELGANCPTNSAERHLDELLEFSDIQTQTCWNSNDNFTQTDFSLFDMENIF